MRKIISLLCSFIAMLALISCSKVEEKKDIELMGAGDRIHDTYTFANTNVKIEEKEENVYRIFGEVDRLDDVNVKDEFDIDNEVNHVVAIKLSANGRKVVEDKVTIKIDGVRSYDSEHLNGSDYTFVILEAVENQSISITVSWNGEEEDNYIIHFDENLILK